MTFEFLLCIFHSVSLDFLCEVEASLSEITLYRRSAWMHGNLFPGLNSSQVQLGPGIFAVIWFRASRKLWFTSRCLEGRMTVIYSHKIIRNIHIINHRLTRLRSTAIKPESTSSLDCSYCQSDFSILKTRIIIKKTFVQVLYIPSTMFMEDAADTGAPVGSQGGDQRILSHSIYCLCTHPHSMQ